MEAVTDFIFLGSKITVDGEIKRCFLLGRKAMTNLDIILKSRDNTLLTKVSIIKAFFFFFFFPPYQGFSVAQRVKNPSTKLKT